MVLYQKNETDTKKHVDNRQREMKLFPKLRYHQRSQIECSDKDADNSPKRYHDEQGENAPCHPLCSFLAAFRIIGIPNILHQPPKKSYESDGVQHRHKNPEQIEEYLHETGKIGRRGECRHREQKSKNKERRYFFHNIKMRLYYYF